ncbi:DUF2200 domain-containing protein [Lagierella sp.]|uniref:DUF2200 domain-containing protein n=1 Tax=Lagierella sp. TaxID=2849657 RepID=UPI00262E5A08|nr:DUF2200 domain-containing protein [Lagierella sp.]
MSKIFSMEYSKIYDALLNKVERKGRSKTELDEIIIWLTGYSEVDLDKIYKSDISYAEFFQNAPSLNPNRHEIKGSICGVKIQEIEDPLMKEIRYLDKLVDELARGKQISKIKR